MPPFRRSSADTVSAVDASSRRAASHIAPSSPLQSAYPVIAFLVVNRLGGLRWAVVVATILSVAFVVDRKRKGAPLGRFMPIVTAAVLVRGALGAITNSEALYFGLGIATKYVVAAVLLGSILVTRPLAALAAPYVLDLTDAMRAHRVFRSTMGLVTAVAALYYILSASLDIWLFRRNDVEGFVLLRFLANWPLSAAAFLAILLLVQIRLPRIPGVTSVPDMIEAKMTAYLPPANNDD